jgi:MarR family transcriptional regulator, organic hydroperoxide resistance regulator
MDQTLWRILRLLIESDGLTMRALADAVSLNRPTMTKVVDKLVVDALVYRMPDPNDRRKVGIFLSNKGRSLFKEQNQRVSTHQNTVEGSFGVEETQKLKEMLEIFLKKV